LPRSSAQRTAAGSSRQQVRAFAAASVEVRLAPTMSPMWIWMQLAIVIFVLIGMVVAITKLA
jgi:hypothetical protein